MRVISIPHDLDVYQGYPESSLFKLDPLPTYLTLSRNLSEIIEEQKQQKDVPPEARIPDFTIHGLAAIRSYGDYHDDTNFPDYATPLVNLPQIDPEKLKFLRRLDKESDCEGHWNFVVEYESREWLLKAYYDDSTVEEGEWFERFDAERNAYTHFKQYKHAVGAVPACEGWVELSMDHIASFRDNPMCRIDTERDPVDFPLVGILIEFFPDAQELSKDNITFALAENAMRGICGIHGCYVLQNDIEDRNCLVVSGDRVVWVDFDVSRTPISGGSRDEGAIPRVYFWIEFNTAWELFYQKEIPK
ncbi:hypothetical protein QCA50_008495 [Cerrena zonata]|uniref:Protein kinase domain-containing protein n=1 Tax=Cerrena zonata TaxID=2478898 RepID=A0AAW0G3Q2_9APHY